MSSIVPNYRTVQDLLQGHSFAIDEYQREYKWGRENIEELLTDLREKFVACYQEGHNTKDVSSYEDYFLGSIIVSKRAGKHFLVDGQQRVTSLTLLLIYLHHEAIARDLPVSSNLKPLIYSDNYGEVSYNLDIPERAGVLAALFEGTPFNPEDGDESIQNMHNRYQDIEEIDLGGELDRALPHFCYWLINRVGLIEIATDDDRSAYAIFETMNDRGKPLSPVDMLKAYLLAPIADTEKRRTANQIWKQEMLALASWSGEYESERDANCMKAWFRAHYAQNIRERRAGATDKDWELIGTAFHRWAREKRDVLGIGTQQTNLQLINSRLPFIARAYRLILEASSQYTRGLEPIFYNAHNAFTWQNTVLLAPLDVGDSDETVRRKMAVTASYLDIWLMRRVVNYTRVSYSSSSYAMYLLCSDIRGLPLTDLVERLEHRLADDEFSFDGNPNRGRYGVDDWRLNQFSKRYIYHLLARLTAHVEVESGEADRFPEYVDRSQKNPYDIEHLWSSDFSRYTTEFEEEADFRTARDHVAGLVLLPADVNRSYGAKPFEEKAPHYIKQNLYAASLTTAAYYHRPKFNAFIERSGLPFKSYEVFGKDEQLERRYLVKQLVNRVWSPARLRSYLPGDTLGLSL